MTVAPTVIVLVITTAMVITSTITVADPGVPRTSPDVSDATGQHGLDHPAVVIDLPALECECTYSQVATTLAGREQGGAASSSQASACIETGVVYWVFPVRGLVPGFEYEVHFYFSIAGDETAHQWSSLLKPNTSYYTIRYWLQRIDKTQFLNVQTSVWDQYSPQREHFFIEVTLRDMHPGLTSEDALIGTRRLNSAVDAVRVRCTDLESEERTKVPDQTFVGQVKLAECDAPAITTPQSPAPALTHGCAARGDLVILEREPLWSMMYGLPDSTELITSTLTRSSVHEKGRTEFVPVSASIPSLECVNAAFRWDNKGPVGLWIQLIQVAEGVQYRIFTEVRHIASSRTMLQLNRTFVQVRDMTKQDLTTDLLLSFERGIWPHGDYHLMVNVSSSGLSEENVVLHEYISNISMPQFPWEVPDDLQTLLQRHAPWKLKSDLHRLHIGNRIAHSSGTIPNLTISISSREQRTIVSVVVEGLTVGAEYLLELLLRCASLHQQSRCIFRKVRDVTTDDDVVWLNQSVFVHTQSSTTPDGSQHRPHHHEWTLTGLDLFRWAADPVTRGFGDRERLAINISLHDTFARSKVRAPERLVSTHVFARMHPSGLLSPDDDEDMVPAFKDEDSKAAVPGTAVKKEKELCRSVAVLVHGQSRFSRVVARQFHQNILLPLDADVFIRNAPSSASHICNKTCANLGRKLAFSGLNLSHFAPLNLCENDQDVYLKVFGDRLKSYSIDDNLHYESVEYISARAQAYFKDGFSTLPPGTHILEANTRGIVSHWYRLSSLASLFVQEESKCEHPYKVIVICRLDSISFETPAPLPKSLFDKDFGDHIFVQEPKAGSLYFTNGLDFLLGNRAPMLDVAFNLVWSYGSLMWDMPVPDPWHIGHDNSDTRSWMRMSALQEAQWSLFLLVHAKQFNVHFYGEVFHKLITPFHHQRLLILPSRTEERRVQGMESKTYYLEDVPKLYAQGFCKRPCDSAAVFFNIRHISQLNRIGFRNPSLLHAENPQTRRWHFSFYCMGTCFHGHVILVCATDIEACLELYFRGYSQAFGQGHELLIDGKKNLPGHYVYKECCEVPIPLEWGLPNLEATSFVANKDVFVVIPEALEDVVSLFILSGGDSLKSLTEDGGDIDKDRKLQEEDSETLGGRMYMISDPIYMHEHQKS